MFWKENLLPDDGTQRKVELVVFSTVSKERVEQIYAELQNVEDIEIVRKDLTPPPPPPLKPITLKKNGIVNFGGKDYTFDEFEQRIIAMEVQHRMVSNKNDIEKYRMRATVTIESGTDEANIVRFKNIMEKGNFAEIHYKSEEQKKTENDSEFAKTENQELKKVVVHLNQNKLNFQGKFCKVEKINNEVQKYIEQNPDTKIVELVLHEPDELSKEITEKVKEELNKITGVEVKVKAVEVMLIKKSESSTSKLEVKVQKDKILLSDKIVSEEELNNKIIDFVMTAGDEYKVSILAREDVSKEKIGHVEDLLFFAGIKPDNMECITIE